MKTAARKITAILEVVLVRFLVFPLTFWLVTQRFPALQTWQTERLQMPFPVTGHILMVLLPVLILLITSRKFSAYGLRFRPLRYHLDVAGTCLVPVVLANIPFTLGIDYRAWSGAWILAIVRLGLLLVLGRILQKQPDPGQAALLAVSWIAVPRGSVGMALAELITYGLFVGFGEEIIFRGYIQSRLNAAFGRPYRLFGVPWGWGLLITSALFGLSHVGLTTSLITGKVNLTWAWGFWTFFGGLVFGFVREKTESIFAPALLHGLPQGIASAIMVLIS
jgi:membrane protease YdiL (CAAX protease family)